MHLKRQNILFSYKIFQAKEENKPLMIKLSQGQEDKIKQHFEFDNKNTVFVGIPVIKYPSE